ncbi:MAG: Stealth CR1 domain-containing protein, partial [Erysipelotrichaceae bacterium]|nr:Stealth CR1 domain-containing protein [Erysipelotrichaceae bacterium]
MERKIDIILPWVDGNDPKWQKIKERYSDQEGDNRKERYRDFGLLKYWFRGIEKNMPWVRKIFLVTMDQIPEWLNKDNPRLVCIDHKDYLPKEYLPTFNSNAIEINLHRIKDLSEEFILFNDDIFVIDETKQEDYFIDGKPVDMLALQPVIANDENEVMSYMFINNSIVIARHFHKLENMKMQPKAYFNLRYPLQYFIYNNLERLWPKYTGFFTAHGPSPLLKSTLNKIWEIEPEVMDKTSRNRFRDRSDVNQYLIREYQKQTGDFVAKNILKDFRYFDLG